ncbi:MAG: hypothetical protein ABSB34_07465 [Candidatus Limnocylindrales bacterium]
MTATYARPAAAWQRLALRAEDGLRAGWIVVAAPLLTGRAAWPGRSTPASRSTVSFASPAS